MGSRGHTFGNGCSLLSQMAAELGRAAKNLEWAHLVAHQFGQPVPNASVFRRKKSSVPFSGGPTRVQTSSNLDPNVGCVCPPTVHCKTELESAFDPRQGQTVEVKLRERTDDAIALTQLAIPVKVEGCIEGVRVKG